MSDWSDKTAKSPLSGTGEQQITIIIPTRNEAENIAPLLEKLGIVAQHLDIEILFVDDSTDDTPQVLSRLAAESPLLIRLLVRPPAKRNGLSGAVVDGLRMAQAEWVCVMDADLQHPPELIPLLWAQAQRTGADLVVGSRRGDMVGPLGLTRRRSLTSKALTILARMLFPRTLKNVSDPLTGLFLVRRLAVPVDVLRPDGFKILLEILVRCPALHVSEIQFDFAPRHEGESKADFREGVRFFRHLVRLRVTVNPHLARFVIVVFLGVVFNSLLLWALVEKFQFQPLAASVFAVELFFLWVQIGFQYWVFRDQEQADLRRGFWASFLASQLFVILIYLPILLILTAFGPGHYLIINLIAMMLVGLIRYGLSEQWIWTKGSMIWQHQSYYYSIHNILNVESQVPLVELQYFQTDSALEAIDIQIRLDRQGTPSRLPGGISYDEHLGRFGFGLTVLPGEFTQVIVSPLLERSPNFLFTNVVEPVLRWGFVRKDFALVKAAGVSQGGSAILIHAPDDIGKAVTFLCRQQGCDFMADDLVILDKGGQLFCYPKPVTILTDMVQDKPDSVSLRNRIVLMVRRSLYTRFTRQIGLWLSARDLPAATVNTYLQWLVPQPKQMLGQVLTGVQYADRARIERAIVIMSLDNKPVEQDIMADLIDNLQQNEEMNSFQPHPLLAQKLRTWHGEDLLKKERAVITMGLQKASHECIGTGNGNWWLELDKENQNNMLKDDQERPGGQSIDRLMSTVNPQKRPGNS